MRLKMGDHPLSVTHNNTNIVNSPKRINTLQNSNITTNNYSPSETTTITTTEQFTNNDATTEVLVLNNINKDVQWCSIVQVKNQQQQQQQKKNNNRNCLLNINNTLATSDKIQSSSTICSSPEDDDNSLLEVYEDGNHLDASPQDEERDFDLSDDTETSSEEINLSRRGIINPNYPGFQHLAHTLDYTIKLSSDTSDFTDDDLDLEVETTPPVSNNNNNNNNNNLEESELLIFDKIDSVNRLDSVENIQKVFHEKTVLENINQNNTIIRNLPNNPALERAVVRELEDAIEKLTLDLEPSATKYNIEPNVQEPFNKLSPSNLRQPTILNDTSTVTLEVTTERAEIRTDILNGSVSFHVLKEKQPPEMDNTNDLNSNNDDAFLSSAEEVLPNIVVFDGGAEIKMDVDDQDELKNNSNREIEEIEKQIKKIKHDTKLSPSKLEEIEKMFCCKEDLTKCYKEKDVDSTSNCGLINRNNKKKRNAVYQQYNGVPIQRRDLSARNRDTSNRRSVPMAKEKKYTSESLGKIDVYNIETVMPKIDMEAIENHLKAAREEERRRRTDREEIRRRLAMGPEYDYYNNDRPGRKPSLQARLQSGMNLQICFMNEAVSDTESPNSDTECPLTNPKKQAKKINSNTAVVPLLNDNRNNAPVRPASLPIAIGQQLLQPLSTENMTETDFFARQARLQTEARMALAQAKQMARMQMEVEKQKQEVSPITEMVRHSLMKVGILFPEEKRRLSRVILTDMNIAQLQVIVNDLHNQIEILNENLVKFLMDRDDLHMEQDSMLVDIEDLTRYLGAKEQVLKEQQLSQPPTTSGGAPYLQQQQQQNNNLGAPSSPLAAALNNTFKPHLHRIASLVKK